MKDIIATSGTSVILKFGSGACYAHCLHLAVRDVFINNGVKKMRSRGIRKTNDSHRYLQVGRI